MKGILPVRGVPAPVCYKIYDQIGQLVTMVPVQSMTVDVWIYHKCQHGYVYSKQL